MRTNIMIDYREGAKSASLCAFCEKTVEVTLTNETLSLCEGLEEVDNVLVNICDECGNIASTPHKSVLPIQQAMKRLVESGVVSDRGKIPVELKFRVDARKVSELNNQHEYPLQATG